MTKENTLCRLAGALYLVVVVTGMFSLMYVPSQLTVHGDIHATLNTISQNGPLFRAGIAAFLLEQVAFLLLPLVLFKLLNPVHRGAATLMVALVIVSVPIALVSILNKLEVLDLLGTIQGQALVQGKLVAYGNGLLITSLFWGLWLLPFGYLVIKSRFLPKVLGGILVVGGIGYIIDVFGSILVPAYVHTSISNYVLLPAAIGEIGICLWLLVVGVRKRSVQSVA